ncbi:hypothetical protein DL764_008116 [Monosporascus ibericus]|uniref:MADS-box domain-containing protein n=1 Tax=Monosporascus ibericus TaxID=155417 RepID=A0A4Q4SYA9_9PEZI|nr:hypothetical protein DL764_008116 [Monosporascus ibericus]
MPRSKNRNSDYAKGLVNRQKGIFKKSNTFYRFYGGDIAVIIKKHGRVVTYQSRPGFLNETSIVFPDESFGPDDFDTVTDRQLPPASGSEANSARTLQSFDFAKNSDISAESPISISSSSSTTASPDPKIRSPQTPLMPFLLSNVDLQDSEIHPDTAPASIPDHIFPSSLLTMPSTDEHGLVSIGSWPPLDMGTPETQPARTPSPEPVSPQREANLPSLLETYFGAESLYDPEVIDDEF